MTQVLNWLLDEATKVGAVVLPLFGPIGRAVSIFTGAPTAPGFLSGISSVASDVNSLLAIVDQIKASALNTTAPPTESTTVPGVVTALVYELYVIDPKLEEEFPQKVSLEVIHAWFDVQQALAVHKHLNGAPVPAPIAVVPAYIPPAIANRSEHSIAPARAEQPVLKPAVPPEPVTAPTWKSTPMPEKGSVKVQPVRVDLPPIDPLSGLGGRE